MTAATATATDAVSLIWRPAAPPTTASAVRISPRDETRSRVHHEVGTSSAVGASPARDDVAVLLRRVADGDESALRELHAGWAVRVARLLRTRCADPQLREEVVIDTIRAVWHSAASYRGDAAGTTWLFAVAARQLGQRTRRRELDQVPLDDTVATVADPAPGPEAVAIAAATRERLRVAMDELSPPLREVARLLLVQRMTPAQAADVLGIPVGTVHSRLFNARKALRAALADTLDAS